MSTSSADGLVEAGVITDHGPTVAGVASLIEQLATQSNKLDAKRLSDLRKIKVIRRNGLHAGERSRTRKHRITTTTPRRKPATTSSICC